MTEQEYKKYIYEKAHNVKTKEDLDALLKEVVEDKEGLDYGKIVYAMCGCMKAAFNYIDNSEVGGITGFQASFIAWEMVREFLIRDNQCGMKIVDYDDMLYPQYEKQFQKTIKKSTWDKLQEQAKTFLKKGKACETVIAHWKSIAEGNVPFGYTVVED